MKWTLLFVILLVSTPGFSQSVDEPEHLYGVVFRSSGIQAVVGVEARVGSIVTLPLPPPYDVCAYSFYPSSSYPYRWDSSGNVYMLADSAGCYPQTVTINILLWHCPMQGGVYVTPLEISACAKAVQAVEEPKSIRPEIRIEVRGNELVLLPEETFKTITVELIDGLGRIRLSGPFPTIQSQFHNLEEGVYFYRITAPPLIGRLSKLF